MSLNPAEVQWLADDLMEWAGGCLVESHTPEAVSAALALIEELVSGHLSASAEFLADHRPRKRNQRPYRVIARRSGGRHFNS